MCAVLSILTALTFNLPYIPRGILSSLPSRSVGLSRVTCLELTSRKKFNLTNCLLDFDAMQFSAAHSRLLPSTGFEGTEAELVT